MRTLLYPIGPTHTSSSRKLTRPLGSARPSPFIYTALLPVSQNRRSDAASPPLASLSAPWVRVSLCECVPSARGSHSTHKPHALHSSDTAASFRSPAPHCRRSHCRRPYVAHRASFRGVCARVGRSSPPVQPPCLLQSTCGAVDSSFDPTPPCTARRSISYREQFFPLTSAGHQLLIHSRATLVPSPSILPHPAVLHTALAPYKEDRHASSLQAHRRGARTGRGARWRREANGGAHTNSSISS